MTRFGWLLAATAVFAAGAASAECGSGGSDTEVQACLAQDLRDSDQRINAIYKSLMASRDEAGKTALRDEQRAWLKQRDKACSLDNKEADREKWLQAILADQQKTSCVVRYTFVRVAQLDFMLQQSGAAPGNLPPAPQPPKLETAVAPAPAAGAVTFLDEGYQLHSNVGHAHGKWYYELWIDRGHIAELGDVLLTSGIMDPGPTPTGVVHLVNIRHTHADAGPVVIGMAVDLDNGATYSRTDGQWAVPPGSNGGTEVKLNHNYVGFLEGSSPVSELVRRGLIKINLGERPFDYSLPDGYRPFGEQG
jgi:uncharacterized protein YecT (DUF1311 family)